MTHTEKKKPRKKYIALEGDMRPTYSECAGAPRATAVDFRQIGQRGKDSLISQRDIDDTMVRERAQRCEGGRFLASSQRGGGDENAGILAPIGSGLPLLTGVVPEGLPLGRKVPVTSGDSEEKSIVLL